MHQLALYVVLYSPVQMAADLPGNYARFADAFQFIRDVPTDWEESIALAGEVGEFVVFARKERGGDDWYLGGISGNEAHSVAVSLAFLDTGRSYAATVYRDGEDADWATNPYAYAIDQVRVDSTQSLALDMASGGGVAIRFEPLAGDDQ
jgi:alpha-glucosidase